MRRKRKTHIWPAHILGDGQCIGGHSAIDSIFSSGPRAPIHKYISSISDQLGNCFLAKIQTSPNSANPVLFLTSFPVLRFFILCNSLQSRGDFPEIQKQTSVITFTSLLKYFLHCSFQKHQINKQQIQTHICRVFFL